MVAVVQKEDQGTGALTEGFIAEILTGSDYHPHGCKVRLTSGEVGRVARIFRLDGDEPVVTEVVESEGAAAARRAEERAERAELEMLQMLYGDPPQGKPQKKKRKK